MTRNRSILTLVLVSGGLVGCSGPQPRAAANPQPAGESSPDGRIHLTANLVPPDDIALEWRDPAPGAAGHTVEFETDLKGEFTTLAFLLPGQTAYTHPDLMPDTTWYYRVRPFYGPASAAVEIVLPAALTDAAYAARFGQSEDYSWAVPKTIPEGASVAKKSIRSAATAAEAAPVDLKAAFVSATVSGFQLTWSDRASDEDGFLLEMKPDNRPEFRVCALLDPNINSFGYALAPPERKASFRVRAFYYGQPSNLAQQATGPEPSPSPAKK